jgi:hypothetical protein
MIRVPAPAGRVHWRRSMAKLPERHGLLHPSGVGVFILGVGDVMAPNVLRRRSIRR